MSKWSIIGFGSRFALEKSEYTGSGFSTRLHRDSFDTEAQALACAARLNGTIPPRLISAADCKRLTSAGIKKPGMIRAIHDIMVLGHTWKRAAAKHQVSEPGIHKALQRIGLR